MQPTLPPTAKPIPDFPGYYACPNGEIWPLRAGYYPYRLKPKKEPYKDHFNLCVYPMKDGKDHSRGVKGLVRKIFGHTLLMNKGLPNTSY